MHSNNNPDAGEHGREGLLDGQDRGGPEVELRGEQTGLQSPPAGTFRKITSGMVMLVAMVLLPYSDPVRDKALAVWAGVCPPGVANDPEQDCSFARAWIPGQPVPFWNIIGREFLGEGEVEEAAAAQVQRVESLAQALEQRDAEAKAPIVDKVAVPAPPHDDGGEVMPAYPGHDDDAVEVPQALELSERALDPFFAALARTEVGYEGAITRVGQWGDSVMAADHVTSALRSAMQRRFGDAGHGFHLLAKPNNSYKHRAIRFSFEGWEHCYIINKCRSDAHFGYGGTTVWSAGGAQSVFRTAPDEALGRAWSRVELWYATQPDGGTVRITVDDAEPTLVSTRGELLADRWHAVTMSDGPHTVKIRADGRVRLYGAAFERDVPGVVWDGMEQLGAFTNRMLYFDHAHLRQQIDHRDLDLLVFMFGGNDLTLSERNLEKYEQTWQETLERFLGPKDGDRRPCLLVAPIDHGQRQGQRIISRPEVAIVVEHQRAAAKAAGCAFFDTPAAMGGDGAAGRWRKAEPPLLAGDLSHLTHAGQQVIGHYLYLALMQGYVAYRRRTDGA